MKIISVKDAAKILKLKPYTVSEYCRMGRLGTGEKLGRSWVITRADLKRFAAIPRQRGIRKNPRPGEKK